MRERPKELSDADVLDAVRSGWDPSVTGVRHLDVGFGAHHWRADVGDAPRLFVTYDRFGERHDHASLQNAYAGAMSLAASGLDFVVAPVPTRTGPCLVRRDAGALSCTPWLVGAVVGEGAVVDEATATANLADLARLHAAPVPVGLRRWAPLVGRDFPEQLSVLVDRTWDGGPFGEQVRSAVIAHQDPIARWTDRYATLAVEAGRRPWVATHGETHTRNQVRMPQGIRFVDWESLMVAPRERDLGTLVQAGYGERTGADPAMLELFDLEWRLAEIDAYAHWFAAPHTGTADDAIAHEGLLEQLARGPWWPR